MFCYQREFRLPTETVTQQLLHQLMDSPQTRWLTKEHRRWRDNMPSILADVQLQEQWANDEEYQKWCIDQENDHRFVRKGVSRAQAFKAMTLPQRLQDYCDYLKRSLPFVIFIATYDESEKGKKMGRWRNQKSCRLNGLCVIDFDHVDESLTPSPSPKGEGSNCTIREIWKEAFSKLSDEDKARVLFVFVTPSGHGLKVVFMADANVGNLIDNQKDFSAKLGLNPDEACKDASRGAFLTTRDDIILINEEKLFTYENKEFGEKYNDSYHAGKSQPTVRSAGSAVAAGHTGQGSHDTGGESLDAGAVMNDDSIDTTWQGHDILPVCEAWTAQHFSGGERSRHEASVVLARDLFIMYDRDKRKTLKVLLAQPWVQQIIQERGEDVERTVNDAATYVAAQESETAKKGKPWLPKVSKEMKEVLEKVGAQDSPPKLGGVRGGLRSAEGRLLPEGRKNKGTSKAVQTTPPDGTPPRSALPLGSSKNLGGEKDTDIYAMLPLEKWAEELKEMAEYYPCMKELFLNVHPHKMPAVLFSSAALFGTLMTRAYYHFWYEPEIVRRLNYCIFIIGDPGAGKNVIEKFYFKIADPMIQADQCLIDAVNRYKDGRTERITSTKAQKGDALKKPVVGIRVHPARTATGEFIRHMLAAVETVQGQPMNLHMFSFDSELDNVTKNNKGGDWKDREILELKAFHNEQDGQIYGNQESITGMFNVFWNFIYTGTPYALHRKVNQRNFGTGMSTRLAVIPLPDKGLAQRHQKRDPSANETIRTWAYRLDRVEGEIPIEPLNDETFDWQSSRMEIAEFNGNKADRTLLKRIPYYGIGVSLPFILMRHWDEWQESKTLTMDDTDKRLCRLAMEIQYKCQQFFFGEMAFNYFADQNKEFVVRRRTTRFDDCYRKLPDEFKTQQMMDSFQCSQPTASRNITRFLQDGIIERIAHGTYRKILQELP